MTIKQKLYLGFCFILAIVLIEVASSWVSLRKLLDADGHNIHAYQVMNTGQALLGNIINIETGQRGFVITGKEDYLEPLNSDTQLFKDNLPEDKTDTMLFYKGEGCERCGKTGYKGRVGLYEIMEIDEGMIKLINQKADANQIKEYARKNGMLIMFEDGLIKAKLGLTTISEILRVTKD